MNFDLKVRLAAFEWLTKQVKIHEGVLPRALLQAGFEFSGERVPLVSPQGIFTPKMLGHPISITTAPSSPYKDVITETDFILYKYRGDNPQHRDNVGLRKTMELKLPLVYFHGVVPGKYVAVWPVYVIADSPGVLEFTVAVDEAGAIEDKSHARRMIHDDDRSRKAYITRETSPMAATSSSSRDDRSRKAYITRETLFRLHQRSFREKVLAAYREQCALCKLRHKELLDAAHIIPDSEEHSQATVNNGISLCKLHHAAFDGCLIGITPDFKVEVKQVILEEEDGPMLQHGLKALDQSKIYLPKDKAAWPNRDFLSQRYSEFTDSI